VTRKIGDLLVIEPVDPKVCFVCGKVEDTRPYGPNREEICFNCMISDPELKRAAIERFRELMSSPGEKPN
jgi:hypothetical protein